MGRTLLDLLFDALGQLVHGLLETQEGKQEYLAARLPSAFEPIGNTLHMTGRNEEAIESYRKALTLDPDNAQTYRNLGIVLAHLGHTEAAAQARAKEARLKAAT